MLHWGGINWMVKPFVEKTPKTNAIKRRQQARASVRKRKLFQLTNSGQIPRYAVDKILKTDGAQCVFGIILCPFSKKLITRKLLELNL